MTESNRLLAPRNGFSDWRPNEHRFGALTAFASATADQFPRASGKTVSVSMGGPRFLAV
jgi:hypothetical protein